MASSFRKRVLFVFKGGRKKRIASGGVFPGELFYGYCELKDVFQCEIIEEDDFFEHFFQTSMGSYLVSVFEKLSSLQLSFLLSIRRKLAFFNSFDYLVLTTNTQGRNFWFLKKLGQLSASLVFFPMGLFPQGCLNLHRKIQQKIFSTAPLYLISKTEMENFRRSQMLHGRLAYLPFGVDVRFWQPKARSSGSYVLSIGNDSNRDFALLIKSWQEEYPPLFIISNQNISSHNKKNIKILKGCWRSQDFSDCEIRSFFQDSLFVILPIKETIQPAGQSSMLQAMACGKCVIFSKIQGIWDKEKFIDKQNCVFVTPGDSKDLQEKVHLLLNSPDLRSRIGIQARTTVEEHFSSHLFSSTLEKILESLQR